jgi:hypothetical protein
MNGTHQLLAYANGVNILGDYTDTIKKKQKNVVTEEVGIKVNAEETKYMFKCG